jgi:hypothetical protein
MKSNSSCGAGYLAGSLLKQASGGLSLRKRYYAVAHALVRAVSRLISTPSSYATNRMLKPNAYKSQIHFPADGTADRQGADRR